MKKKPSSGLGFGLWLVGGLVGVYLLGATAIVVDSAATGGMWFTLVPDSAMTVVNILYRPFFENLNKLGIL